MPETQYDDASAYRYYRTVTSIAGSDVDIETMLRQAIEATSAYLGARQAFYLPCLEGRLLDTSTLKVFDGEYWGSPEGSLQPLCDTVSDYAATTSGDVISHEQWVLLVIDAATQPAIWIVLSVDNEPGENTKSILSDAAKCMGYGLKHRRREKEFAATQRSMEAITRGMAETMAQLVQAEKMSELGKLTAGIAHEINNPVGYIRSNLESLASYMDSYQAFFSDFERMLKKGEMSSQAYASLKERHDLAFLLEDSRDIVDTNLTGVDRISNIVSELYAFSRRGEGKFKPLKVGDVVERCITLTRSQFDTHHEVIYENSAQHGMISGDSSQLEQVFVNMMINAAHAMPGGGTLTLNVSETPTQVQVRVADTGTGMDKATRAKIFTPFFTTKPTGKGTGLGLAITQGILHAHDAVTDVSSEVNKGTSFTMRFPRVDADKQEES